MSRDGRRVVVGGFPTRVYDAATGEVVREVAAGQAVAMSPDGERLALAADDWDVGAVELRIVSAQTGRVVSRARAIRKPGRRSHTARTANTWPRLDMTTLPGCGTRPPARKSADSWVGPGGIPEWRLARTGMPSPSPPTTGRSRYWPVDFDQDAVTVKAHTTLGTRSLALDATAGRVLGAGVFGGQIDEAASHKKVAALAGRIPRIVLRDDGGRGTGGHRVRQTGPSPCGIWPRAAGACFAARSTMCPRSVFRPTAGGWRRRAGPT